MEMRSTEDLNYYKNITAFQDFSEISQAKYFHPVPESWCVLISDVKGSTKAIQEGRYKQVNLIGASCISGALGVIQDYEFPFVFGGDGATMLIPQSYLAEVCENLRGIQALSQRDFGLELRVGYVPMQELYKRGYNLQVGKHQLSIGNNLAQFKGSAINQAELWIKKKLPGAVLLEATREVVPKIQGLSCRMNPFRTKNGVMLSLLCAPQSEDANISEEIIKNVLFELRKILNNDFQSANPIQRAGMSWPLLPKTMRDEVILSYDGKRNYWIHVLAQSTKIFISNFILFFNLPLGGFRPEIYKSELSSNSDYKKFDGTLRMVIDCTEDQAVRIDTLLSSLFTNKKIYYGLHRSQEALMTCMVQSASNNQHTHFIDGADGGYAMAAVQMKNQMKESKI